MQKMVFMLLVLVFIFSSSFHAAIAQEYGEYQDEKKPAGQAAVLQREKEKLQEPWSHQFYQNGVALDPAKRYTLTFWAKGTQDAQGHVSAKMNQAPWGFLKLRHDFVLDEAWHVYTIRFPGDGAVAENSRLTFQFKGTGPMELWIADVVLSETGGDGTNLLKNARFENGTRGWRTDGHGDGNFSVRVVALDQKQAATDVAE